MVADLTQEEGRRPYLSLGRPLCEQTEHVGSPLRRRREIETLAHDLFYEGVDRTAATSFRRLTLAWSLWRASPRQ